MAVDSERRRAALDWYEDHREDLLAALEHARRRENDAEVIELALSAAPFLAQRPYWDESEEVARWGLDAAERAEEDPVAAEMLNVLGTIHRLRARFEESVFEFEESARRFRDCGDGKGAAAALNNLGVVLPEVGKDDPGRDALSESVRIWRALEQDGEVRAGLARSLNNFGTATVAEDPGGARGCFYEALALREEIGDEAGAADALDNLGQLAGREGDWKGAVDFHGRALGLRREADDEYGVPRTCMLLAMALAELGQTAEARSLIGDALAIDIRLRGGRLSAPGEPDRASLVSSFLNPLEEYKGFSELIEEIEEIDPAAARELRLDLGP